MYRYVLLSLLLTAFLGHHGYSQLRRQQVGLFVYNAGFGGFTAGIGSVINKDKKQKVFPAFWKGFKYGCLGGALNYTGKRITHSIRFSKDTLHNTANPSALLWAWPSKIVHSVGSSIIENAARNEKKVFNNYRIPVGFIHLSLSFKNKVKVQAKLMPFAFTSFSRNLLMQGNQLRLKETLFLGTPYFVTTDDNLYLGSHAAIQSDNCIVFKKSFEASSRFGLIMSHEHIHVLQEREYFVFNEWLAKPYAGLVNKDKAIAKFMARYIYPDLQYHQIFYQFFSQSRERYYKNIFELEAEHFATNSYIKK